MPELRPVDYLLVGHVAVDLTPTGAQLGGTVAYAALTAQALGLRVGAVTSAAADAPLAQLQGIQIVNFPSPRSTTFENVQTESGRRQILHSQAAPLSMENIPLIWRDAKIVHLAPIAQETDADLAGRFPNSWVGVTPQGWMRGWDEKGSVVKKDWENSDQILGQAGGAILSIEDVNGDLELVERMANQARLLCLTEGARGAVLYWNGDRRRFRPPTVKEADATGAGDIFAAAFFARLQATKDPWEAARFATCLAAHSVTRVGLLSVPTEKEIALCAMEVLT
ncbi:MAG: PfkB family carbohydrate kinase [Anaerolineales bacterium]|nr:PfkB family carbohydrate kinase [Anaerolineales bacterium]